MTFLFLRIPNIQNILNPGFRVFQGFIFKFKTSFTSHYFFMVIHDFSKENSVLNQYVSELRDVSIQKDRLRFRFNIERISAILSYEMSKTLDYKPKTIQTPLGTKAMQVLNNEMVLCSILRAGIPFHHGILNFFDQADNAFISAYRIHHRESDTFEVETNYLAAPDLDNKTLILADPMLATGKTFENVYRVLKKLGKPKEIHLLAIIGAKPGIELLESVFPQKTRLWIATVDDRLDENGYIVPGLGDAGDLCYGPRLGYDL